MAYKHRFFESRSWPPHDLDFRCLASSTQVDDQIQPGKRAADRQEIADKSYQNPRFPADLRLYRVRPLA